MPAQEPHRARVPLSRPRVVAAAVALIDESGLSDLTMQRLGQRLEVEAMSLYRYVPDKRTLLDAVAEMIVDEIKADSGVFSQPTNGWQHFLEHLAHGIRRVALRHPNAFPLLVAHPPGAAGLRAPLQNLFWAEAFHSALISEGFTDHDAMSAYRAFSSFLIGHLLHEVAPRSEATNAFLPRNDLPQGAGATRLSCYPTLIRLQLGPSHGDFATEFGQSLEGLLNVLALQRNSRLLDP